MSKSCPQDRFVPVVDPRCSNCDGNDHRLRDCPEPIKERGGRTIDCRKCGEGELLISVSRDSQLVTNAR